MATGFAFGEALALGLASGPVCVASCGPVVIPPLLAEPSGLRLHGRYLTMFLAMRLLGYLLFAAVAWELGALVTIPAPARSMMFAVIHLLLAAALLRYAYNVGRGCTVSRVNPQLVTISGPGSHHISGAAVLGFLTGVSLCPPFVAAGVRATEAANVVTAILFFAVFFLGTAVWFVPFAGLGWIRRNEGTTTVARMTLVLIGLYYSFSGLAILIGKKSYGY